MIRCYLDNQPVSPPQGLDSLQFKKIRHRTYFGFTYRRLGYVSNAGTLAFTQRATVDYLTGIYRKQGVMAQTSFRLESDQGGILYDGWINYNLNNRPTGVFSFSLRDDLATTQLESQALTQFAIPPARQIALPGRTLDTAANLTLNEANATVQRILPVGRPLVHAVPVKPVSDKEQPIVGTLSTVTAPLDGAAFYTNTTATAQTLHLRGSVSLTTQANLTTLPQLVIRGEVSGDRTAGQISMGPATSATQTLVLDQLLTVAAGGSLRLLLSTPLDVSSYTFVYSSVNLSIARYEQTSSSTCAGVSVVEALGSLVSQATDNKCRAVCEGLDHLFLTSGANLRGLRMPIKTTLRALFEGLDAVFNLQLDCQGDRVVIRPKTTLYPAGRVSYLDKLSSLSEKPNDELLFSEITVGFSGGTGEGLLSALEPNTTRTYRTALSTVQKPARYISSLITSSNLIEQQRRKQFDTATATATKADNLDESLFLICTDAGGRPAGLTGVVSYEGLIDPPTAYNLAITPRRNLNRWLWLLAGCGPLTLTASDVRQAVQTRFSGERAPLVENQSVIAPASHFVPDCWLVSAPMSLPQYQALGDWVVLPDGRRGLLMEAEWRESNEGQTGTLLLWEMPAL